MIDLKMKRMYQNNIFKSIDISKCKIDTVITILNSFNGYSKTIKHDCFIFYITEYSIFVGIIFDEYGTVIGKENDEYWILKDMQENHNVINPLFEFKKFRKKVREIVGNVEIEKYIIMGGNCIFRVPLKSIKILRMNCFQYILNKKDMKQKYSKEQIDEIYNDLFYLNDKNEILEK